MARYLKHIGICAIIALFYPSGLQMQEYRTERKVISEIIITIPRQEAEIIAEIKLPEPKEIVIVQPVEKPAEKPQQIIVVEPKKETKKTVKPEPKKTAPAPAPEKYIEKQTVMVFPKALPEAREEPAPRAVFPAPSPAPELPKPRWAEPQQSDIDAALLRKLMAWVEAETGAAVPNLPKVVVSHEKLSNILKRMGVRFAGRPQSAYVPGTVVMDDLRWDAEDSTQLSLLVHELVHHSQLYMKNAKWPCPDAREAMAYNLQNKWLEQNGHYPFVRASWIERISSCGGVNLAQR